MRARCLKAMLLGLLAPALVGSLGAEPLNIRPLPGAKADVAALLFSDSDGGALWVAAAALPPPDASESALDLVLEIDGPSLLEGHPEPPTTLKLETYVYALERSKLAHSFAGRTHVSMADHGETLRSTGLRQTLRLPLGAGEYALRVLVRDKSTQRFALRRLEVTVPKSKASKPSTLGVPRVTPAPGWVTAESSTHRGAPFVPWPVWVIGRDEPLSAPVPSDTAWVLADAEDRPVTPCTVQVLNGTVRIEGGAECAGSWTLRPRRGKGWRLPVVVLDAAWAAEQPTWAQIRRLLERSGEQGAVLRTVPKSSRIQRRSQYVDMLMEGYREVFEVLADGRPNDAVDRLLSLDAEATAAIDRGLDRVKAHEKAVDRLGRQLAAHEPEALLPALWLHLALHDRYAENAEKDPYVLGVTWSRVRLLAELYTVQADHAMARAMGSTVLAALGVTVDEAGMTRTALGLFEDATEMDPDNRGVWRHLAAWHERNGRVERAVDALERLLALAPELDDARLRLAVGLRRLGRVEDSLQTLEPLLRRDRDPAVSIIAHQEASRLHLQAGRFDVAIDLLERAVDRFPGSQRLPLQLAHALERHPQRSLDQRRRASALLDDLPPDSGPSSRYGFQQSPEVHLGRTELRRHVNARLPALSRALDAGV